MKVAINMLLWATHVTRDHLAQLRKIKRAGADGVEIPIMEGRPTHFHELAGILDDLGLERTGSMAFVTPEQNPVSDRASVRQAALDEMHRILDCAEALGVPVVCGPMFQTLGVFTGNGVTAAENQRVITMLRKVAPRARQANVTLALEPLNRFEAYVVNTMEDGAALVKRVGAPNVGLLYDTFHANIEEKDAIGAIRKHGRQIRHFHCSANDRGIPGQDHIPWLESFRSLRSINYDGWLVIEAFGRALPGLAAATRIWRDMFPSSDAVIKQGIPFVRQTWEASGRGS
jgi:D-psicose/D-tagatose/L-ribulose 3-epimerase